MRIGLHQWYANALKPLQCRGQNAKISKDISDVKALALMFRQWHAKANA